MQDKKAKTQVKTDGIPWAKKARIFHCKAGQKVEEMVESARGEPNVICPWCWKFCSLSSKAIEALALQVSHPSG